MITDEDILYEERQHGFSLALATMYMTRAQKAEVYELYDVELDCSGVVDDAIAKALNTAGVYDSRCQGCNVFLGEDVTALCGACQGRRCIPKQKTAFLNSLRLSLMTTTSIT